VQAWCKAQGQCLDEAAVGWRRSRSRIDHSLVQYLDIVDTGQGDVYARRAGLSSLIARASEHPLAGRKGTWSRAGRGPVAGSTRLREEVDALADRASSWTMP